jgi:hypothetical protein
LPRDFPLVDPAFVKTDGTDGTAAGAAGTGTAGTGTTGAAEAAAFFFWRAGVGPAARLGVFLVRREVEAAGDGDAGAGVEAAGGAVAVSNT